MASEHRPTNPEATLPSVDDCNSLDWSGITLPSFWCKERTCRHPQTTTITAQQKKHQPHAVSPFSTKWTLFNNYQQINVEF